MIAAYLSFHPHQKNPARASGLGVWRVAICGETQVWTQPRHLRGLDELVVITDRMYKRGSRVDPRALVLRGLALKDGAAQSRICPRCGTAYFPPYPAECDWCPGSLRSR